VTPSELAFLALGLVLGIATGAAIVVILRMRPPTHEIRLTVAHDALPRRASTLSSEAARWSPSAPAAGGPADRRSVDRDSSDSGTAVRYPAVAEAPAMEARIEDASSTFEHDPETPATRVLAGAIGIERERDPAFAVGGSPDRGAVQLDGVRDLVDLILDGDHHAMLRLLDALASDDGEGRRRWELLLATFVDAARERAVDLGVIDFPMGNRFWDTFTVEQCRRIAVALDSMGHRFDGHDGWVDQHAPAYRDLSIAVADIGVDPRRLRAWPNTAEIAELYAGARVAAAEAMAWSAPTLELAEIHEFLGSRAVALDDLWLVWDAVRTAVMEALPESPAEPVEAAAARSS
jgi:hypothetical protein